MPDKEVMPNPETLEETIKRALRSYKYPCAYCPANKTETEARECNECLKVHTNVILQAIEAKLKEQHDNLLAEAKVVLEWERKKWANLLPQWYLESGIQDDKLEAIIAELRGEKVEESCQIEK